MEKRKHGMEKATKGMSKKEQALLGPKVVGKILKEGYKRATSGKKGK